MGQPFLMEVNTRIQVENGVSAAIARIRGAAGVDIIAEQIRLALGQPLGYDQGDITFAGVGIEYRIIAEDPASRFTPWVGRIDRFAPPEREWLRFFSHIPRDKAYLIPTEFDPNLALAIVWGRDLARGVSFLDDMILEGADQAGAPLKSNVAFLREKTAALLHF
jgi:acetyl/propionyl-CoA carboxylase alpha subunit